MGDVGDIFIAVFGINSTAWLPQGLVESAVALDTWLLASAMAALGLTTQRSAIRQAGVKPLLLALLLFVWLVLGGAAFNRLVTVLFP